ncbi:hypothetical protein A966_00245 [Brachyspira hampsonii 30446]|uniref:Uncharacterized protein n=1 Tax=Brachyspira hampsonii 30446 TaxID=1289135 RepID=A0A2U4EY85_9SPIR|nr:hypothetical protein A966_00245 [Brachyspira hampsonii 30446]
MNNSYNNERLECHHSLGFYIQVIENILNKVIK